MTLTATAWRGVSNATTVVASSEFEAAYPARWGAAVSVTRPSGGTTRVVRRDCKGDPHSPLAQTEIIDKARSLLRHGGEEETSAQLTDTILGLPEASGHAAVPASSAGSDAVTDLDLDRLRSWEGRQESREDVLALAPVRALAATLDHDPGSVSRRRHPATAVSLAVLPRADQIRRAGEGRPPPQG